jgi:SAM-dependent methyltransferase
VTLNDPVAAREQYRDSSNLGARADLHVRYSTNDYGFFPWVLDRMDLPPTARILDVGGGPGWLWRAREVPWKVVGTDLSHGMTIEARANAGITVAVADAQALPFAGGSFDAIVANHMLYHVPDLDAALAEFVRVLRPGGHLFAATNGSAHMKEVRDILGINWRYIDAFGLENGPEKIAKHFTDVAMERYPDAIEVPEADPVVAYVMSMSTFWSVDGLTDRIRTAVEAAIEREGVFRITKDAGLITARRP